MGERRREEEEEGEEGGGGEKEEGQNDKENNNRYTTARNTRQTTARSGTRKPLHATGTMQLPCRHFQNSCPIQSQHTGLTHVQQSSCISRKAASASGKASPHRPLTLVHCVMRILSKNPSQLGAKLDRWSHKDVARQTSW